MKVISLNSKIQAGFQPSLLDNWITNDIVLSPGYEKLYLSHLSGILWSTSGVSE